ncbi:hypothetical protein [Microbacterium sp. HMWF026]|uniref:hypothetical protein n=1 Tax=Microbacterium sp. HMWF026 TaxID=2056861 RepID=UPI0015E80D32|nr:hypothetical protein [Microbacterium sp. HMWF026]
MASGTKNYLVEKSAVARGTVLAGDNARERIIHLGLSLVWAELAAEDSPSAIQHVVGGEVTCKLLPLLNRCEPLPDIHHARLLMKVWCKQAWTCGVLIRREPRGVYEFGS